MLCIHDVMNSNAVNLVIYCTERPAYNIIEFVMNVRDFDYILLCFRAQAAAQSKIENCTEKHVQTND